MAAKWLKPVVWGINWAKNQEFIFLILLLAAAVSLLLFLEIADEVREGDTRSIDEQVLRSMRHPDNPADAIGPAWFEEAVRDVTALGSVTVLVLLSFAACGFLAIRKQFHALAFLASVLLSALVLNVFLKGFFDRARPDLVPHLVHVSQKSFPSGHSLLATVVYLTLASLLSRLVREYRVKIYIVFIAASVSLFVGISRVYLGVHYPSDVIAGWVIGVLWAILCWLIARKLQRKGVVEPPG